MYNIYISYASLNSFMLRDRCDAVFMNSTRKSVHFLQSHFPFHEWGRVGRLGSDGDETTRSFLICTEARYRDHGVVIYGSRRPVVFRCPVSFRLPLYDQTRASKCYLHGEQCYGTSYRIENVVPLSFVSVHPRTKSAPIKSRNVLQRVT